MIIGIIQKVSERLVTVVGRFCKYPDIPLLQQYGLTSTPPDGAQAVIDEHKHIIVATDDKRYRIPTESGEVALYHSNGDKIHLKNGRIIEVVTETLKITGKLELTGDLEIDGDMNLTGDVDVTGDVDATGVIKGSTDVTFPNTLVPGTFVSGKAHIHPTSSPGAPTSAPSGPPAV